MVVIRSVVLLVAYLQVAPSILSWQLPEFIQYPGVHVSVIQSENCAYTINM